MTTGPEAGGAATTTAGPDDELHPEPSQPDGDRFPLRQVIAGLVALALVAAGIIGVWIWNDRTDDPVAAPVNAGPQVGDHWHAYLGLAVCSTEYANVPPTLAARGMFAAADGSDLGVIHIQPTSAETAGTNATVNKYLSQFNVVLSEDGLQTQGTPYPPGGQCTDSTGGGTPVGTPQLSWSVNGKSRSGSPGDYVPADGDVILVSYNPHGTDLVPPPEAQQRLAQPAGHPDLATAQQQLACVAQPAPAPVTQPQQFTQADQVITPGKTYTATITTSCGDVTVRLDAANAPKTVNNFVFLARKGFYDGTPIHRVIPGFVVQAGDPTGQGNGGPGYTFADENLTAGYAKGTVAMANAGKGDNNAGTNGSQFFIVTSDEGASRLTPDYSVFGTVTGGADVLALLDSFGDGTSQDGTPLEPLAILKVTVTES
jgi:cyclophilin family peptidyl-prolyl cis-trans isomerase